MSHDWECLAHGHFEARGSIEKPPKCPRGCSSKLVKMVFLQPVGHVSARTRTGDRLVREMAQMQNLSDISTSPSRSGGSVADRNRKKMLGPQGRQYPAQFRPQSGGQIGGVKLDVNQFLGAFPKENPMTSTGFGHAHEAAEWKTDDKTGKVRHVGAQPATELRPPASVERVKEKRT